VFPGSSRPVDYDAQMLTNRYNWEGGVLEAEFFNEVLVAYRISSR
jgi:hypothetical protein